MSAGAGSRLFSSWRLGGRAAPNRVLFGPHVTNLGAGRSLSKRHLAYYRRRAEGGCGVVVTEEMTVHPSDWPYERAPDAAESASALGGIAAAVHREGGLLIAAVGHSGLQGSSAYSQRELWAPSPVPDPVTRECPKEMELEDIEEVLAGFARAAAVIGESGADGVEINAGQHSLIRQFLSGLTNQRRDDYGSDRTLLARRVVEQVRSAPGAGIVGMRLCCDEFAPWAGITPEAAAEIAASLAPGLDYIAVSAGSIFTPGATRPDGHTPPGFSIDLARSIKQAVGGAASVVVQGSIVTVEQAEAALSEGLDGVEMTRAQIADPDLVRLTIAGRQPRPCVLCNQLCMSRDPRNPIVSCAVEPGAGHETEDPDWHRPCARPRKVTVVGGGPAGMEAARVAAVRGHQVRLLEASDRCGGALEQASRLPGRERFALFARWQEDRLEELGVAVETGALCAGDPPGGDGSEELIICAGGVPKPPSFEVEEGAVVLSAAEVLSGAEIEGDRVVVWDPIGAWEGVGAAEALARRRRVTMVSPDPVIGRDLARTGDLAPANTRLQTAGVRLIKEARVVRAGPGEVKIDYLYSDRAETLEAEVLVDADHRLPAPIPEAWSGAVRAGDCVAPRTVAEAVLEGRRAVLEMESR